jgi:hypothetical protein
MRPARWLSEAPAGDPADLAITVRTPVRRPYWSTPAHNPAAFLLSLALPFW